MPHSSDDTADRPHPDAPSGAEPGAKTEEKRKAGADPAAGPHAKPHLVDEEKTPGAGSLPDPDKPHEGDATTG
ncbi:hypothetical protein [Aquabacter spiritensis]|uniref:Uncharacterized protein n=1 Tax=Aquabacter spiritensis TaxID=933073 RepID=A0A4R3M427_9HYPH|nr:hypothetical protein [Aquabacter spiritensis]TCT07980.1 hypothetical protein EDC64_101499 [Aquabacter spiritensis]